MIDLLRKNQNRIGGFAYLINVIIIRKDYMMYSKIKQEVIFVDYDEDGVVKTDWRADKEKTLLTSDSFKRLNKDKKAMRLADCGTYLEFVRYVSLGKRKLFRANFCKCRLCPICMKRRSKKIYGQTSKVMDVASKKYEFLFLTLTVKNCEGEDLKATLDMMFQAWTKLFRRKQVRQAIKGWFRGLEVTHNEEEDTYHPHFHVILTVDKKYFKGRNYIKQDEYKELWRDCLGVDYDPIVDIRRFRASNKKELAKSLAEAAKYTVKDTDILKVDLELTDRILDILDEALAHRRLTAFGGVLKDIHKDLNLDDAENGDLINTDNEDEIREDLQYIIECVGWDFGLSNYYYKNIRLPEETKE